MSTQWLISSSYDCTIKVWDLTTGVCKGNLKGHTYSMWTLALWGTKLVGASEDGPIKIWDLATGVCERTLEGHTRPVTALAISGTKLVSGSFSDIKIWDLATSVCERTLEWNTDGNTYRPGDLALWGTKLVSGNDYFIKVWDLATGICERTIKTKHTLSRSGSASNPSIPGTKLVVFGGLYKSLIIYDLVTGIKEDPFNDIRASAFILWGSKLVIGCQDKTIKIWDLATSVCERTFNMHTKSNATALALWGTKLVSNNDDNTIEIWDLATGVCERTLKGHNDFLLACVISPPMSLTWLPTPIEHKVPAAKKLNPIKLSDFTATIDPIDIGQQLSFQSFEEIPVLDRDHSLPVQELPTASLSFASFDKKVKYAVVINYKKDSDVEIFSTFQDEKHEPNVFFVEYQGKSVFSRELLEKYNYYSYNLCQKFAKGNTLLFVKYRDENHVDFHLVEVDLENQGYMIFGDEAAVLIWNNMKNVRCSNMYIDCDNEDEEGISLERQVRGVLNTSTRFPELKGLKVNYVFNTVPEVDKENETVSDETDADSDDEDSSEEED